MKSKNTPVYFTKLKLENIRSFGELQCLNLMDGEGRPAQWTLILGDNGVGKTTLLQCLARMRPKFNEPSEDDGPPSNPVEPELCREEDNSVLKGLTRSSTDGVAKICAEIMVGRTFDGPKEQENHQITTSIKITRSEGSIEKVDPDGSYNGDPVEPLVLAYGAGRHMGITNFAKLTGSSSTDSLFDAAAELFDAEEMLYQLDYHQLKDGPHAKKLLLASLTKLLAEILPALNSPDDIDIRGLRLLGSKEEDGGVWVKTPSGIVELKQLSLGYQTVVALMADIAWRMLNHYPDYENPLLEPAIVIIDEIDLHLHPKWQRTIRKHLIHHFPAVQFITTAHSPLMAQDALDTNLAVIRDQDGQAVIESQRTAIKTWRVDQVLTSNLFGIESARPVEIEKAMKRRIALVQKEPRTVAEQEELKKLDDLFEGLPTAESIDDHQAMEIVRQAASFISSQ